jgi:hypothetical protein
VDALLRTRDRPDRRRVVYVCWQRAACGAWQPRSVCREVESSRGVRQRVSVSGERRLMSETVKVAVRVISCRLYLHVRIYELPSATERDAVRKAAAVSRPRRACNALARSQCDLPARSRAVPDHLAKPLTSVSGLPLRTDGGSGGPISGSPPATVSRAPIPYPCCCAHLAPARSSTEPAPAEYRYQRDAANRQLTNSQHPRHTERCGPRNTSVPSRRARHMSRKRPRYPSVRWLCH